MDWAQRGREAAINCRALNRPPARSDGSRPQARRPALHVGLGSRWLGDMPKPTIGAMISFHGSIHRLAYGRDFAPGGRADLMLMAGVSCRSALLVGGAQAA